MNCRNKPFFNKEELGSTKNCGPFSFWAPDELFPKGSDESLLIEHFKQLAHGKLETKEIIFQIWVYYQKVKTKEQEKYDLFCMIFL